MLFGLAFGPGWGGLALKVPLNDVEGGAAAGNGTVGRGPGMVAPQALGTWGECRARARIDGMVFRVMTGVDSATLGG